ncbi:MAG: hypothetical protein DDT19_01045 [Syntrophomonadaceae bacterium]|nr:hypothetical protein [Bacillota bacterium]
MGGRLGQEDEELVSLGGANREEEDFNTSDGEDTGLEGFSEKEELNILQKEIFLSVYNLWKTAESQSQSIKSMADMFARLTPSSVNITGGNREGSSPQSSPTATAIQSKQETKSTVKMIKFGLIWLACVVAVIIVMFWVLSPNKG